MADQNQGDQSEAQDSQEQATQDSGLQTPQPDQPVPSEEERQESESAEEVDPGAQRRAATAQNFPTNADQEAQEAQRQSELQGQRDEHNARTAPGGGQL